MPLGVRTNFATLMLLLLGIVLCGPQACFAFGGILAKPAAQKLLVLQQSLLIPHNHHAHAYTLLQPLQLFDDSSTGSLQNFNSVLMASSWFDQIQDSMVKSYTIGSATGVVETVRDVLKWTILGAGGLFALAVVSTFVFLGAVVLVGIPWAGKRIVTKFEQDKPEEWQEVIGCRLEKDEKFTLFPASGTNKAEEDRLAWILEFIIKAYYGMPFWEERGKRIVNDLMLLLADNADASKQQAILELVNELFLEQETAARRVYDVILNGLVGKDSSTSQRWDDVFNKWTKFLKAALGNARVTPSSVAPAKKKDDDDDDDDAEEI